MGRIYLEGCNRHCIRTDFSEFCQQQVALGKKHVEIWGAVPHMFIDHCGFNDTIHIKEMLDEYNLICDVFTPKPYYYNLADPDSSIREWSLSYFRECIKATRTLCADNMLIYLPAVIRNGDKDEAESIFIKNIEILIKDADAYHVSLALGGMNAFAKDLPEFISLVGHIGESMVKSFLEIENLLYSQYSMKEWLHKLSDTLIHIHFSDAKDGGSCKIGDGCLPVRQYLDEIRDSKYEGGLSPFFTDFFCEQKPFEISMEHEKSLEKLFAGERFYD